MDKRTAQQTAKNWSELFCQPFYIVELAEGIYEVAARVTHHQKVVGPDRFGDNTGPFGRRP